MTNDIIATYLVLAFCAVVFLVHSIANDSAFCRLLGIFFVSGSTAMLATQGAIAGSLVSAAGIVCIAIGGGLFLREGKKGGPS